MLGLAGLIILHFLLLMSAKHLRTKKYLIYMVVGVFSLLMVGVITYYMLALDITPKQLNQIEEIFGASV